jgi:CHAT domain-containing protein
MFFNACEAGRIRTAKQKQKPDLDIPKRVQRSAGLAEAFLRGGLANYVGTYWPVGDIPAKRFGETFYTKLLEGKSIGEALLEGRKELRKIESLDWADYIHYGSSSFVLKRGD